MRVVTAPGELDAQVADMPLLAADDRRVELGEHQDPHAATPGALGSSVRSAGARRAARRPRTKPAPAAATPVNTAPERAARCSPPGRNAPRTPSKAAAGTTRRRYSRSLCNAVLAGSSASSSALPRPSA